MSSSVNAQLFMIDNQYDFCDPNGALSVPGADADAKRVANMITRINDGLKDIHATLDSHQHVHIAHPIWHLDPDGNHPAPFTLITREDYAKGKFRAFAPNLQKYTESYLEQLEQNNRYVLCIWPPHCIIGTPGHALYGDIPEAIKNWCSKFNTVNYITKGSNIMTEHYSAIQADVPHPSDPSTSLNVTLLNTLLEADIVLITGQASSHCVANTVRDVANNFGDEHIKKLVFIEDTSSPVPGFENMADDFINEMVGRGMQISTSDKILK